MNQYLLEGKSGTDRRTEPFEADSDLDALADAKMLLSFWDERTGKTWTGKLTRTDVSPIQNLGVAGTVRYIVD